MRIPSPCPVHMRLVPAMMVAQHAASICDTLCESRGLDDQGLRMQVTAEWKVLGSNCVMGLHAACVTFCTALLRAFGATEDAHPHLAWDVLALVECNVM